MSTEPAGKGRRFAFRFEAVEEIRRLPETWPSADFRRLLRLLDFGDADQYDDADLEELALMALQDRPAEEAMALVLTHFTHSGFRPGQISNLCEELKEEDAWEEYPEIAHHRDLYLCIDVLNRAHPYDYPEPAALRVRLTIQAPGFDEALRRHVFDAATLLRGIGRCQDSGSVLNRFFDAQIAGGRFPEAEFIVWRLALSETATPNLRQAAFCSSRYWFRDIDDGMEGTCSLPWPPHG